MVHALVDTFTLMAFKFFLTGKIANLVPPHSVDSLIKLILVNSVYIKGNWYSFFDKKQTKEMPFKISQVCILHYQ
jgi:serine protease inhibitor